MNNSTSTPSAAWPTTWPSNSFPFWKTLGIALAALAIFGLVLLGGLALLEKIGVVDPYHPALVPLINLQTVAEVAMVVFLLVAIPRLTGFSLRTIGFTAPKASHVAIALLGTIAMVVFVEGGDTLIQKLSHHTVEQPVVQTVKAALADRSIAWILVLFTVVVAPFLEEMIFRVFVFNVGLRYGGFWVGALVSGVLFGLAHTDPQHPEPITPFSLAIGGVILSAVYYRTRNAFASVITHGCFNGLTMLALIYAPQLSQ